MGHYDDQREEEESAFAKRNQAALKQAIINGRYDSLFSGAQFSNNTIIVSANEFGKILDLIKAST